MDENREELQVAARNIRKQARKILDETEHEIPYSNAEWLRWLGMHEGEFRDLLKSATKDRRCISDRLQPPAGMDQEERMQPIRTLAPKGPLTAKLKVSRHGFFAICSDAGRVEVFSCALKGEVWVMILAPDIESDKPSVFSLSCTEDFCDIFRPIQEIAEKDVRLGSALAASAASSVRVSRLTMRCVRTLHGIALSVQGLSDVEIDVVPDDSDGEDCLASSGSDVQDLVSDVDSEVDKCLDDEQAASEEQEASESSDHEQVSSEALEDVPVMMIPKAAPGTNVVMRNGIFTLVRDPKYSDAKMLLLRKWAVPELLGKVHGCKKKSKTCLIRDYDGNIAPLANPTITYLVLRSWMVWRSDHSAFLDSNQARRCWHNEEIEALRADVRALEHPGGGTGSEAADSRIRTWCPAALL